MGVAEFLHVFPRFDIDMSATSNHFKIPDSDWAFSAEWFFDRQGASDGSDYLLGVFFYSFVGCIIALIALSLWSLFQCIKCVRHREDLVRMRLEEGSKCIIGFIILSILALIITIVCCSFAYINVEDALDRIDHSADNYDEILTSFRLIDDDLNSMYNLCEDLRSEGVDTTLVAEVEKDIKTAQKQVDDINNEADGVDWHLKDSSVPTVWGFLAGVCIISLILFICTAIEFYEEKIEGCKKTCWKFSVFIFLFFLWLFILGQFTMSMIIGDGCQDQTDTVKQVVDRAEQPWDIAEYYVVCNSTMELPWKSDFNEAYTTMDEIAKDIAIGSAAAKAAGEDDILRTLDEMLTLTNSSVAHLTRTESSLQCSVFHNDYKKVTDLACGKFLNLWFVVYLFQTFMIIFLSCAKCGNSCMYTTSPKDGGHWYGRLTGDHDIHYTNRHSINGSAVDYGSSINMQGTNAKTRKCCERLQKYEGVERELQVEALKEQGYHMDTIQKALAILRREENLGHDTQIIDYSVYNL